MITKDGLEAYPLQIRRVQLGREIIYDRDTRYELKEGSYGLANVAPTVVKLMDIPAPACWEASMV